MSTIDRKIKVTYTSVDGARIRKTFKTIAEARAFAVHWVGEHPELGRTYAVSGDGVGKITVEGCTLAELFAKPAEPAEPTDAEMAVILYGDGLPTFYVCPGHPEDGQRVFNTKADDEAALAEAVAERELWNPWGDLSPRTSEEG